MSALRPPILCLVTDRRRTTPDARSLDAELSGLEAWLDQAVDAGIDLIQIRERDLEALPLYRLARRVVDRAHGTATRVVVNDRADVAIAAGAGGVHLRADGPEAAAVRALLPAGAVVGRSTHAIDEVARYAPAADYLLFGTLFESRSKPDGWRAAGRAGLEGAVAAAAGRAPVLAIGGVTLDTARACAEAGAGGLAGIGLFLPGAVEAVGGFPALAAALGEAFARWP